VRPRQKDLKFKATLDYIGRPCLKKQKKQNKTCDVEEPEGHLRLQMDSFYLESPNPTLGKVIHLPRASEIQVPKFPSGWREG
jgi:hypothetical protein